MKHERMLSRRLLPIVLAVLILGGALVYTGVAVVSAVEVRAVATTTPTGYTKASDVTYQSFTEGTTKGVKNWGARGEACVFLSPNAEDYYVGNYDIDNFLGLSGGTQSTAPSSELYKELKSMMADKHDHETSYAETRYLYAYTDCVSNDSSKVSSFYVINGKIEMFNSTWDSGKTWNREHTWPNSKGLNGNDENDIMMLRPENSRTNSSRGNSAYGESGSFYDPGKEVRGDCARILLYVYTRWGNTSNMWGSNGVIENLDTLLRWMKEDPVDTWEMGRNDAVESITGVRNVYVDYPELGFLLFNEEVPSSMVTPSGLAGGSGIGPSETNPTTTKPGTDDPGTTNPPATGEPVTITFSDGSNRTVITGEQQVWVMNGVTVTNDKAASSSAVADYLNPVRCYKGSNLTIAYENMAKLVINCAGTDYASALAATPINAGTPSRDGTRVTITLSTPMDSVSFTKLSAQVRISSIDVYVAVPADSTEPGTTEAGSESTIEPGTTEAGTVESGTTTEGETPSESGTRNESEPTVNTTLTDSDETAHPGEADGTSGAASADGTDADTASGEDEGCGSLVGGAVILLMLLPAAIAIRTRREK